MSSLIIIESPNKIKKVAKYSGMNVKATVGHFKDLPMNEIGIDFNDNYKPKFVYTDGKKKKNLEEIKKLAKGNDVYIATDPDREGYAIGTMVYWEVKNLAKNVYRAEIHEITEKGVKEALQKVVPFEKTNKGLFNAFLGRRVGDRLVGYILSPIASKQLQDRFSVGRVQSPAVRLVVEREREIRNFKPSPYWEIVAVFEKDGKKFTGQYIKGKIEDKEKAEEILNNVKNEKISIVKKVERKKTYQKPKAPFTTSDLQITANSQLRFAPEKTMKLAQDLFEAGLITYHRTDSVRISDEYINQLRDFIPKEFGDKYLPEKPNEFKSKNSQADAHEGIRPTGVYPISKISQLIKENGLTDEHKRLLELIYKRTVASQMANAVYDSTTAILSIKDIEFKSAGRVLVFDGFLKLYRENKNEEESENTGDQTLPALNERESVNVEKVNSLQKFTKPPNRYNEGSLVKMLEKLGIGRPSTYASIMQTIKKRGYVKVVKGKLVPTEKGEKLIDFLTHNHNWIIDYEMTKKMEDYLDKVEEGSGNWVSFVKGLHSKMNYYVPEKDDTPSEKMIQFANDLAGQLETKIPEGVLKSKASLKEWIDKRLKEIKENSKPSEKMMAYAKSLAEKTGTQITQEILNSRVKTEEFINKAKKELEKMQRNKPLTEKQTALVEKYAPDNIKKELENGNYSKVKKWIDEYFKSFNKGKSKGKSKSKFQKYKKK